VASAPTVADVYVRRLAELGIEYLFANGGTDFPPIVEALAKAEAEGAGVPRAIAVPHENAAMAMAQGFAMATGRPQAVMVHVTVGTANALCGLINMSRDRVPVLLTAGRTPLTESGQAGARNVYIHWAQESFDQAAMVREYVKWDFTLTAAGQMPTVLDRAFQLAVSEPKGPVYHSLPRETLASPMPEAAAVGPIPKPTTPPYPDPSALAEAAEWIAAARLPLIVTAGAGRDPAAFAVLDELCRAHAIAVVQHKPRYLCLASDHPMNLGYEPGPFVAEADVVVGLDCDVPWIPSVDSPSPSAKVVHLGVDPLFQRYPLRGFPAALAIVGDTAATLKALRAALDRLSPPTAVARRRTEIAERRRKLHASWSELRERAFAECRLSFDAVSSVLSEVIGPEAIVVNENPLALEHLQRTLPGSYFGSSPAGGLGFGLGAALGVKLAARDRLVVAALGDGAYMFGNPTSCHFVARAQDLPILTVVFNNAMWGGVWRATRAMYPDGYAVRSNRMAATCLDPSPSFEKQIEAHGGHGERVETLAQLRPALERALEVVAIERRQALVNVVCH
jgi:acetolactate synthase-1/2/3 large subunit